MRSAHRAEARRRSAKCAANAASVQRARAAAQAGWRAGAGRNPHRPARSPSTEAGPTSQAHIVSKVTKRVEKRPPAVWLAVHVIPTTTPLPRNTTSGPPCERRLVARLWQRTSRKARGRVLIGCCECEQSVGSNARGTQEIQRARNGGSASDHDFAPNERMRLLCPRERGLNDGEKNGRCTFAGAFPMNVNEQ